METLNEEKFREYYYLLNKWIRLKILKKQTSEYFTSRGYKKIAIYGMGEIGKRLYDDLAENALIHISFFIDHAKSFGYNGIDVIRLNDFFPEKVDAIVVSITWGGVVNEIKNRLKNKIDCPIIAINEIFDSLMPQRIIPFLVVSVGQACNFKCKDCGTMAPYSPKDFLRYSSEDIIRDIKYILDAVDFIERLQIQGGEPFLYTDLKEIINFVGMHPKIREIEIATNGSIIPPEDIFRLCRKYSITIRISNYGFVKEAELLQAKCREFGIRTWYYSFTNGKDYWYFKGIQMNREENEDIVEKRFRTCNNNICLTLERGRVAYCSRGTNAYVIQDFNMKPEDICIINDRESLGKELMEYINGKHAMEACRYCYGTDSDKMVLPAQQIKRD